MHLPANMMLAMIAPSVGHTYSSRIEDDDDMVVAKYANGLGYGSLKDIS
jgi:hypothetical protein